MELEAQAFTRGPIVKISDGHILGRYSVTPEGNPFFRFQGIPYAAPPVENLRFADPQNPSKWSHLKDCTNTTIMCNQFRLDLNIFEGAEDCLILNVYTPKLEINSNLAVMVYFHGGGFTSGSSTFESSGPDFFMDLGVVIVTFNYRLGPFGFLSTGDAVISGNFGLKDQQLALKWVQKNINVFGGDPKKVTIFGLSAGSASVGFQVLNKKNEGLFRAAVMSSGSPINIWSLQRNPKKIAHLTAKFINGSRKLSTSDELLQFLRSVPASDLTRASAGVIGLNLIDIRQLFDGLYYAPVLDLNLENRFLDDHPYESLEKGNFIRVPLMIGISSEEFLHILKVMDYFERFFKKCDSHNELLVHNNFNVFDEQKKKHIGHLIYKIYAQGNSTLEKQFAKGIRLISDQLINNGVIKHGYLASVLTDVFLYQFSYDGLMGNFSRYFEGADRVAHGEDENYLWRRNLPTANNTDLNIFPEEDKLAQKRLLRLYTNFAKYLNPTVQKEPLLQNILWPTVNPTAYREAAYLNINSSLEIKFGLKGDTFLRYNDIFETYSVKPVDTF